MLAWRAIAAADVTALGASAKMKPPSASSRAFDATCSAWLGGGVDTILLGFHRLFSGFRLLALLLVDGRHQSGAIRYDLNGRLQVPCRLPVSDARVTLPNFYNVAIGIADVAARLAVFGFWFGDELGASTFP